MGVGFGRGCEGAIVDGAGREGVAAVKPVAEPPQNGDAQQSGGDLVSPDLQIEKPVTGLMGVLCKRETLFRAWRKVRDNGQHSLSKETRDKINQFEAESAKRLSLLQYRLCHHCFEFYQGTYREAAMKDLKVDWRRWTPVERAVAVLIALGMPALFPALLLLGAG